MALPRKMPDDTPALKAPPGYSVKGKMLVKDRLDRADFRFYTLGFKLTDMPGDEWSARFKQFKDRSPVAVRAGAATICEALDSINFPAERRYVLLGAISSGDKELVAGCPVHALCDAISRSKKWEWPQHVLSKRVHKSIHSIKTGAWDRDAEVANAYTADQIGGKVGVVVIVDDFVTRGSTAAEIKRAVLAANPGWDFRCLALGKTEKSEYWKGEISNSHIPNRLATVWDKTR